MFVKSCRWMFSYFLFNQVEVPVGLCSVGCVLSLVVLKPDFCCKQ